MNQLSDGLPQIRQFSVDELIDRNINEHHRSLEQMVDRFRNTVIVKALTMKKGNIRQTANLLGMSQQALKRWMDHYLVTDRDVEI
jgi:transcriptional regulator with PAS, ATPase and Fis domain